MMTTRILVLSVACMYVMTMRASCFRLINRDRPNGPPLLLPVGKQSKDGREVGEKQERIAHCCS